MNVNYTKLKKCLIVAGGDQNQAETVIIMAKTALIAATPFLVVDTRSVETTIAVGQNMQMCHSLRCKQIDRSTGTQLKSIQ